MKTSDFSFNLPERLIAQNPVSRRDNSRLLCLNRNTGNLEHKHFFDLPALLKPGDCLVLNDSRVLKARLIGTRENGSPVEVLLLNPGVDNKNFQLTWECLVRPGRKAKPGTVFTFGDGMLTATVIDKLPNENYVIGCNYDGQFAEIIDSIGHMPLPPYINSSAIQDFEAGQDPERYQTVYSRVPGSAAAPTAGLHFTHELLSMLSSIGVNICYITLHVGLGTFRPVKTKVIEEHIMHSEHFTIPAQTVNLINSTKKNGGRIIAVGTTSCRTLETVSEQNGKVTPCTGNTDIFIYPGYKFKCIDGLITNFHLPESTLIMLVSAFAGRENTLNAYNKAIAGEYRFYSFGDAMFIY